MLNGFERSALGLVAALAVGAAAAAVWWPPIGTTAAPRAVFQQPEPAPAVQPPTNQGRRLLVFAGLGAPSNVRMLSDTFSRLGYDLKSVRAGADKVPRLFLASFPADMAGLREIKVRKAIFFKTVLPLILQVNEEVMAERRRLWRLRFEARLGLRPRAADRLWLEVMAERYETPPGDLGALIRRVDIIPPSLALAQAAEESGWGTSRFVREGNALFGQWVFSKKGALTPRRRDDGKRHKIKAFENLLDAARAYARNLNTHRAYGEFRKRRGAMRRLGKPLDGTVLAGTMVRYSERGTAYIRSLRVIISVNGLSALDAARLHDPSDPAV